jgi:DNA-directed RNA polymerase alpha subunit
VVGVPFPKGTQRRQLTSTYLLRAIDSGSQTALSASVSESALAGEGDAGNGNKLLGLLDSSDSDSHSEYALNGKSSMSRGNTLLDQIYNKFAISCKESRIETNTSFYGCFYLGPFEQGESVTLANALRRTLLADLMGVAITSVEIEGAAHEYASITGVRESVLDILLNLKEITLKQTTLSSSTFTPATLVTSSDSDSDSDRDKSKGKQQGQIMPLATIDSNYLERKKKRWGGQVGYLRVRGPGVIRASDLKLPPYIVCVDPEQYIATLSDDGVLNMKFFVSEGKNYVIQVPNKNLDVSELKRRRLLQKRRKQAAPSFTTDLFQPLVFNSAKKTTSGKGEQVEEVSKRFVRYAPLLIGKGIGKGKDIPTHLLPLLGVPTNATLPGFAKVGSSAPVLTVSKIQINNPKGLLGIKSFFNLRKQKKVFNHAFNGNRLPIDAVFMPVTKVNYIIEPDEQSNDMAATLWNHKAVNPFDALLFSDNKSDSTHVSMSMSKTLSVDSDEITDSDRDNNSPSFGCAKEKEEMITEFQNLDLKPPIPLPSEEGEGEEQRAFSNLLVNPLLKTQPPSLFLKHPFFSNNIPSVPFGVSFSKDTKAVAQSMPSPVPLLGAKSGSRLRHKKGSTDVNFTFLHPAPFLSLQDKERTKSGWCEGKTQEGGLRFKDKTLGLYPSSESDSESESDGVNNSTTLATALSTLLGVSSDSVFSGQDTKSESESESEDTPTGVSGSGSVAEEQVIAQSESGEVFTKKDPLKFTIILEIWTNGSIHPRKALYDSFKSMITLFSRLQKVQILGSMLKSERFYNKLIEKKFTTKNALSQSLASLPPLTSK